MSIPFFDGHNDTLLRLLDVKEDDQAGAFIRGGAGGHLDLPRARAAGMAGGFFAMFAPPVKGSITSVVSSIAGGAAQLPPELGLVPAQASTQAMAAMLLRLERRGALAVCRNAADIRAAMAMGRLAAVFHIEGAEALDTDFHAFEVLYAAGLRSIGPVWSRANAFGTGVPFRHNADPDIGPGLSDAGKALVKLCNERRVMVDLSHLNAAGFRDVAAISTAPLVATHSNVHAISPHARNLTAWQLAAIRESGGVVGLNFATGFLRPDGLMGGEVELEQMVRHVDALVEALGEGGVALGSDFDGATVPQVIGDVTGVPKLLQALLDKGYGEALVRRIALENWLDVIERTLG